jgi:peptidoglycan/LPS O-acetylase OafA/YrhL
MIQRIQSLFLLLAAACAFGLFALPFATVPLVTSEASQIFADGMFNIRDHVALLALFCIAGGLALISIFMFKNRKTQMIVARLAVIANIIGLVLALVIFMQESKSMGTSEPADEMGLYLPILFLIFGLLALWFIGKDEKLVRSMDRLR